MDSADQSDQGGSTSGERPATTLLDSARRRMDGQYRTRAARSYSPANWERLQTLRHKHDPDGLFHGYFTGAE